MHPLPPKPVFSLLACSLAPWRVRALCPRMGPTGANLGEADSRLIASENPSGGPLAWRAGGLGPC